MMVSVGLGSDAAFYGSIGMTDMEVEQGYDGAWYVKGYAPVPSDAVIEAREAEQRLHDTQERISEIREELITAILTNDTDEQERLKSEYK